MKKFFIIIITLFLSCENKEEFIVNFIENENLPLEELTNSEILYTENGKIKVKVLSKKMDRYSSKDERIELSDGVHFDFFRLDSLNSKSVLTCHNAIINNTNNIMIANDNVILKSSDNKTLKTEQLIWDKNKNIIYTDLEIQIITDDEVISGIGFQSTPDFSEYEIKKAKGTFNLDK